MKLRTGFTLKFINLASCEVLIFLDLLLKASRTSWSHYKEELNAMLEHDVVPVSCSCITVSPTAKGFHHKVDFSIDMANFR
uniref:Putative ovule protein n=1 Tax=Solanum chacoense TaxID=4108 RepID=A0A0V0GR38_SOLCH